MRNKDFNVLDNADSKTMKKISERLILSSEEMDRMYAKSRRKLQTKNKKRNSAVTDRNKLAKNIAASKKEINIKKDSNKKTLKNIKVSSCRPVISVAACIVLFVGTAAALYSSNKPLDQKLPTKTSSQTSNQISVVSVSSSEVNMVKPDNGSVSSSAATESLTESAADENYTNVSDAESSVSTEYPAVTSAPNTMSYNPYDEQNSSNTDSFTQVDHLSIWDQLTSNFNIIYNIYSGEEFMYGSDTELINGITYAPVIPYDNEEYTTIESIEKLMKDTFTDSFIASDLPDLLGTDNPLYIEHNGKLYINITKTRHPNDLVFKAANIINITDSSFTAETFVTVANDCATKYYFYFVLDGDTWKISSYKLS